MEVDWRITRNGITTSRFKRYLESGVHRCYLKWLFSMLNLKIHEESENEEEQIHDLLEKNKKENGVIL